MTPHNPEILRGSGLTPLPDDESGKGRVVAGQEVLFSRDEGPFVLLRELLEA